ncbi:hypothetical protein LTR09_009593 [Extremus antarcticus]|uniref:C2H2-type domain-containing protein n=1 Tax=Extremus antarcticus TaxID=702011 RepID=A0AAJ0DFA7_9PEZI|nr:hypothetical protein LTR09_009593 [Extremus antarcticus]
MAPRSQALPQATTDSAREARKSFFCELCHKGYARMNDFEAHEGSYDHQHRKRLKDLRTLTRDPAATAKARAAEQKANEETGLKSIALSSATAARPSSTSTSTSTAGSSGASAPKKKPVFKSTLQPHNAAALGTEAKPFITAVGGEDREGDPSGAVRNGWFEERYRPRFVTGCEERGCAVCNGGMGMDLGEVGS